MNRFKIRELTLARIVAGMTRRLTDLPDAIAWQSRTGLSRINRNRLKSLEGQHTHQRCFIIGNGPSLARMDLALLSGETTFGLNRIYLLFDRIKFIPTYYVCVNELVLEQFSHEIQRLPMPRFLNWNRRSLFDAGDPGVLFVRPRLSLQDYFSRDITGSISGGGTVTFAAMQIAYYLGFQEIILIGVDHNFVDQGTPNRTVVRAETRDLNHFHPDYFPKGSKWQLPDLKRSEIAYALARERFEQDGRWIRDATVDGKCTVFEKVGFDDLFR
jgi:hypothetical protein